MANTEEVYAHAPLLLNLEFVDGAWRRTSTWCNLGLWDGTNVQFRVACTRMASLLGNAAHLNERDTVLDVGIGFGDQLDVWVSQFCVRHVAAVEVSRRAAAAARDVAANHANVQVFHASATCLPAKLRRPSVDVVLCLDCAYHFRTRRAFVHHVIPCLRPGGRFAAVDLVLPAQGAWSWKLPLQAAVALLSNIPLSNLSNCSAYAAMLFEAGFEDVSIERVQPNPFAGLASFAFGQRWRLRSELTFSQSLFLRCIGSLMRLVACLRLFDIVLVSANLPFGYSRG